jgi:thioesterase domain-containing protein
MSILANNLYNLSLIAMGDQGDVEAPLPTRLDFSKFDSASIAHFERLVASRFGRSWDIDIQHAGLDLKALAQELEQLPQVSSPERIHTFRETQFRDAGMVLFFPGQHGLARTFQRFTDLIDDRHSVLAVDYDGIDERFISSKTMQQSVDVFYRMLLQKHEELVNRLAKGGGEVVIFGFCIGGCYAHDMARHLVERHDLNVRLVIFDGHPAEWYSGTGARELLRKTKKILQMVRAKGRIERNLVRQGRRQIHLLGKHVSVELDVPALLLRSNSIEESWGLSKDVWQPFVRECQQVDIQDLSHLDLFQRRMESRISPYLQPGYRFVP